VAGDSTGGAWSVDLDLSVNVDSPGVAGLWARARIGDLLDAARRGADAEETRSAIVATALRHHLVSKYTSLVAVDKTPARPADEALLKEQVGNLMPFGQSGSAIFGFPATATNAANLRLTGLLALLGGLLLLFLPTLQRRRAHGVLA
jgi:Ca-activated chloride channel family protein